VILPEILPKANLKPGVGIKLTSAVRTISPASAYLGPRFSAQTCDQPQPCLVTATPELTVPKKDGYAKIPTTNGTITLPVPNDSTSSVISSEGGEEGDEVKPSGSQDGSLWKIHTVSSPVHFPAAPGTTIADSTSTPTPSPNTRPEAATPTSNEGAPRPCHSISVTSLTSNDVHPATAAADASFWQVNMHKVLNYFITKHPKVVSAVSTVLTTVGSIALHPGVAACIGGPSAQHAVQAVGAVAVAVGKWLRTALNSAATKAAAQAQLSD
jgi:hypothetical protein